MTPGAKLHLSYIDGMRALAALFVVSSHAWLTVWPVYEGRQPSGWVMALTGWSLYSHFAVSIFITISGFCLTLPIARRQGRLEGGVWRFFARRARRILPPFYGAVALCVLLISFFIGRRTGTQWDISVPISARDVIADVLMLPDLLAGGKVNHVFWSIGVEWRIYFLLPVFAAALRFGKLRGLVLTAVVLPYTLYAFVWLTPAGYHWLGAQADVVRALFEGFTVTYMGLFGLGMMAAVIVSATDGVGQAIYRSTPWMFLACMIFLALVVLVLGWSPFVSLTFAHWGILDAFAGLCGMSLLIKGTQSGHNPLRDVLSWKPLVLIGGFSYSLYLIHAPLLQLLWQYVLAPLHLQDALTYCLLLLIGVPIVLVIAYLFHLVCERPFMTRPVTRRVRTRANVEAATPHGERISVR